MVWYAGDDNEVLCVSRQRLLHRHRCSYNTGSGWVCCELWLKGVGGTSGEGRGRGSSKILTGEGRGTGIEIGFENISPVDVTIHA